VAELRPHFPALRAAGVEVALIGSGGPHFANPFRDSMKLDVPVYSDPDLHAFQAASFHRSLWSIMRPEVLAKGFGAFRGGHRQRRTQGDALQQGGVLLVMPDGTLGYRHASRYAGDHAAVAEIVAAGMRAAGG
jgi:hypothetical protein